MKRIAIQFISVILIMALLEGCSSSTSSTSGIKQSKFPAYKDVSFGGKYLDYLAESRENVVKALNMTDDTWDYLKTADGSRDNPRPNLKEFVTVDGRDYMLYFRFTEGPAQDSPSYLNYIYYERIVETADTIEKQEEIRALFDLLRGELGEPEEQYWRYEPVYVRDGLTDNFTSERYTEKWVLAENIEWPDIAEDTNVVLLCTLQVQMFGDGVNLQVEYRLEDSAYTGLSRYPQKRAATGQFFPD